MGLKPVKRRTWIKFLKSLGLVKIRTKGSHEIWNHEKSPKLRRPIVVQRAVLEIPRMHLAACLLTLDMTEEEFLERLKKL